MSKAHSPKGASSAERWMNCPGSTALIQSLDIQQDTDEPEYRAQGSAAHAGLEHCLTHDVDAWEIAGQEFEGLKITDEMTGAIQVFLDYDRSRVAGKQIFYRYTEEHMAHPDFHPDFYGTVDRAVIWEDDEGIRTLDVRDFKYGEGIPVEVEWNVQLLYYVYGILRNHPEVGRIVAAIVQPRIPWHPGGVVREFTYTRQEVIDWAEKELLPAMNKTEGLMSGDHCRFCPAKIACPMLTSLFRAAATCDPKEIVDYSDEAIDLNWPLIAGVKMYAKALEAEALTRLNRGNDFEQIKLVHMKANRTYKPEAPALAAARFGGKALTKPELKSPAELEKLGEDAKLFVKEWAYTPQSGLTVALTTDKRVGVKVQKGSEVFAGALKTEG